jgi:hypothetical protein
MKKWVLLSWYGKLRIFSRTGAKAILDGEAEHGEQFSEFITDSDDRKMLETMRDMAERD